MVLLVAARAVRACNVAVARAMAWLALAMVVTFLVVVVLRYGFGIVADRHVRVDVLRNRFPPAAQRRVEIGGHLLLLLPFALFLLWAVVPYVAESWRLREASVESSGLPVVYLLKTLMPVAALQLALQAVASAVLLAVGGETLDAPAHEEGL